MKNTIDGFLRSLPVGCRIDKINGVSCRVQFIIDGVGEYILEIGDGSCAVVTGKASDPEITIIADDRSFVQWVLGVGDVPVKGDFSLIQPAFDRNSLARKMMENIYRNANKRIVSDQ